MADSGLFADVGGLRLHRYAIAMLTAATVAASLAQQATPNAPAPSTNLQAPSAGPDGAYFVGPSVTAPQLVKLMAAGYPEAVGGKGEVKLSVLTMIVSADGVPTKIKVVRSIGDDFDASAINAVKLSKFAAGLMNGKPVPVRIDVATPFRTSGQQAVPYVVVAERDLPPPPPPDPARKRPSYQPPVIIHIADADFPPPAGKFAYPAVAIVSVMVDTNGLPQDVRISKGQGFGMDKRAVNAVKKYRFLPATKKGKPVADYRDVEVKFWLF